MGALRARALELPPEAQREPKPLEDLRGEAHVISRKLIRHGIDALCREEVACCRLYTGPLHCKYNLVLRARGDAAQPTPNAALQSRVKALCQENFYSTTIHIISLYHRQNVAPDQGSTRRKPDLRRQAAAHHARAQRARLRRRHRLRIHVNGHRRERRAPVGRRGRDHY